MKDANKLIWYEIIRTSCVLCVAICEMWLAVLSKRQKRLNFFSLLIKHILMRLNSPKAAKRIGALYQYK